MDLTTTEYGRPVMVAANTTQEQLNYEAVSDFCQDILQPTILTFGFTGNIMNLVIFTRHRMRHRRSDIEMAAVTGLMFLAMSDMMYCLFGLMTNFVWLYKGVEIYYMTYKAALLNTFQYSSTWFMVAVAVERYLAVTHPFKARREASSRRTATTCIVLFLMSVIFNIPLFFKIRYTLSGSVYVLMPGPLMRSEAGQHVYTIVWSVFGIFVPFAILAFCNVRFLVVIYRSQALVITTIVGRIPNQRKPVLNSTTVTLVSIIWLFFVLVCPAMVLEFIGNFIQLMSDRSYYRFQLSIVITNTLLGLNFAVNFLLYCYAIRDFRKTLANMVTWVNSCCCFKQLFAK